MSETIIIGGGFIGLCSAYYLQKEGHTVTVIDSGSITDGCSFGNMGHVCPSHFVPLASPGIIAEGLKYMLSSSSPFYIKPRLDPALVKWVWHFYKNSSAGQVKKSAPHLNNILQLSRRLMNDMRTDLGDNFEMEEKGLFMMCKHQKALEQEYAKVADARKFGLIVETLNGNQVQDLEPEVETAVAGAVLFKDDCHFDPAKMMHSLKVYLEKQGVIFQLNCPVSGFEKNGEKVNAVITSRGKFNCDNLVIAAGSWIPIISKMLGIHLLLQPGKGYSVVYNHLDNNIHHPAILVDGRCAITPWGRRLSIGGTMELSGINNKILVKRMQGIYESAKNFYPGLQINLPPAEKIWSGLRPVTPDGLPFIGKISKNSNAVIAGGHAMLGISQGTGTGLLVSQLLSHKKNEIDISAFDIHRF